MKLLKRFGHAIIYLAFIALGIYIFRNDSFNDTLNSDQGFLINFFSYFKDADMWSMIFATITFGGAFGLFFLISFAIDKLFKFLAGRYEKTKFLGNKLFEWIQIPIAFIILLVLFIFGSNIYVARKGSQLVAHEISSVPDNSPVFILGTSKYLSNGTSINLYYKYRIDAALELWNAGKVKEFILSGDGVGEGHTEEYDETKEMKEDLLAAGVPLDKIKIDPYGFNTQQSIIRLRGVFKLNSIVIVSQDFHTRRAVVLCNYYGIESKSFDAKGSASFAMNKKEFLMSRPRLIIDILYANMQPQVTTDGEFAYREEFSATKSNKHVGIVLIMIALVVVALVGYGIYTAKQGEERKKVAIRMAAITGTLSISLVVLVIQTYKNLDIKFIDEIVETATSTLGIGEGLKEKKIERQQKEKEEEAQVKVAIQNNFEKIEANPTIVEPVKSAIDSAARVKYVQDSLSEVKKLALAEKKKNLFNTQEDKDAIRRLEEEKAAQRIAQKAQHTADSIATAEALAKELKAKKKKNLFNSSTEGGSNASGSSGAPSFFDAKVLGAQKFTDNQEVTFRTSGAIEINGISLPANYVFKAKANVFDNKVHFIVKTLNSSAVNCQNYVNKSKGMDLTADLKFGGEAYLLSDGMVMTFGVSATN